MKLFIAAVPGISGGAVLVAMAVESLIKLIGG
jgi:hypothetical protein